MALIYETWTLILSEDNDYVNVTHLAVAQGVNLRLWLSRQKTKTLLKHLEDLDLIPIYTRDNNQFLRIELLQSLLEPEFVSPCTPPVNAEMFNALTVHALSKARFQMGEDFFFIELTDRQTTVDAKMAVASQKYKISEERLRLISGLHRIFGISHMRQYLMDISHAVPEVTADSTKILQRRNQTARKRLTALQEAIRYEKAINCNNYRMLLAMSMIHASNRLWIERAEKQESREFSARLTELALRLASHF